MATNISKARDAAEEDLESQIAALRKELSGITQSLSDQGYDLLDQANATYHSVRRHGRKAVRFVGDEAQLVADKAKENPLITVAVISAIAGIGLLAGLSAYRR